MALFASLEGNGWESLGKKEGVSEKKK